MDFAKTLSEFASSVSLKMDNIFKDVVIEVGSSVIRISPVDTGHFRKNWQLQLEGEQTSEVAGFDTTGASALAAIVAKANNLSAGQVAYILNHVEYGYDLEYGTYNGPTAKVTEEGFSRQAPEGMVRVTEAEFTSIVNEAVRLNN